jgi:2-oxoglutarate dehydrogenase E1 component
MGPWPFVADFIREVAAEAGVKDTRLRYTGRDSAGSPATGSAQRHRAEQAALIDDALTVGKEVLGRIASRKAAARGKKK